MTTSILDSDIANNEVAENSPIGTVVGVTAILDPALGLGSATYSLIGGTTEFVIDPVTGTISVNGPLDYEAGSQKTLTVQAQADGQTFQQDFIVNLLNVSPEILTGTNGNDTIVGGTDSDYIDGLAGADRIDGGAGADHIYYDAADTRVSGGSGEDTLLLRTGEVVDLTQTADQVQGGGITVFFDHVDASEATASSSITGNDNDNILTGGSGDDVIFGGNGNDVLSGGLGADAVYGEAGDDLVVFDAADLVTDGGTGNNTLLLVGAATINLGNAADQSVGGGVTTGFNNVDASGGSANVSITGNSGQNLLKGGAGADYIDGGLGADTIDGGLGNDTIVYDASDVKQSGGSGDDILVLKTVVVVDLSAAADQVVGGGTTVFFDGIDASAVTGALTLTGNAYSNSIVGGSGNDNIFGGGGDDTLDGGAGRDGLDGGDGNDRIFYDAGDKKATGGVGVDTLVLRTAQVVDLSNSVDQVVGVSIEKSFENIDAALTTGANSIKGSTGGNLLIGGSGADTIIGNGGYDTFIGGDGADVITGGASADNIDGGDGDNIIVSAAGSDTITSGDGNDQINSGDGDDVINAGDGNNSILSGIGKDRIQAGSGNDFISAGDGDDNILSNGGNDTIDGGIGRDVIDAGDGDDIVTYDANDSRVFGGLGHDKLVMSVAGKSIDLTSTVDQLASGGVATGFEDIDASAVTTAILIKGSDDANLILSGSGADNINGGLGADSIDAGGGNDTVTYDVIDALVAGGAGVDTLVVSKAQIIDLGHSSDQIEGGGIATGFENIDASKTSGDMMITGNDDANSILTGTGYDTLYGGGGDDIIRSGDGNDTIDGGTGADVIDAGAGKDTVVYDAADISATGGSAEDTLVVMTGETVNLANTADQVVGGGVTVNFDHVDGSQALAALSITGNKYNNVLSGGAGTDAIDGGLGNDTITGHGGNDVLTGGSGADHFVFTAEAGHQTVTDFHFANELDVIDLTALGVDFSQVVMVDMGSYTELSVGGITIDLLGIDDPAHLTVNDFLF